MTGRKAVGYDELMRVMDADKVEVEQGDMACFYTGWGDVIMEMQREVDRSRLDAAYLGLDGRDDRLLQWITDRRGISRAGIRPCPCTSIACSSWACIWGRSGI